MCIRDSTHTYLQTRSHSLSLAHFSQVRMRATRSGPALKFVYDCPDFEEFNIFTHVRAPRCANY
eukprot:1108574-Pleurochrysis_carterae.AAC.1